MSAGGIGTGAAIGLSAELLGQAFPFHFVVDRALTVVQSGHVLSRLCGDLDGRKLGERLTLVAPETELRFEALRDQPRNIFLYRIAPDGPTLKGQMMSESGGDHLLFLGTPWLTDVSQLAQYNLELSDFATHDPLSDLLFLLQAKTSALHDTKQLAKKLTEKGVRLRESEKRYRGVVDGVREVIFQTDMEGKLTFLNPAWTATFGFSVEHSLGRPIEDFVHPEDRACCSALHARVLSGQVKDGQAPMRFVTNTEKARWIAVRSALLLDASDRVVGVMGTLDDITERKLAEEAQMRSRAELSRTLRLKDEFLANMSHELRTPLNAILGLTEALIECAYGPVNEQQTSFLKNIEESGRHLLALINEILDLSKIEAGTLEVDVQPTSVADVCTASLRMVKQLASRKKQKLSIQLEEDLPEVLADERRLKQVLVNLLNNAVKFTPDGGSIGLEASYEAPAGAVRISVRDTGMGISPSGLKMLFKPFVQLDGGLNRKHEGAGLGLSLVHRLTELQSGSVSVESTEGVGSRFSVVMRAIGSGADDEADEADDASDEPASEAKESGRLHSSGPVRTILLAEDNDMNIRTVAPYLQYSGYRVEIARNGLEALSAAQLNPPDLVLMDVQMPQMDGLTATRQMREDPRLAKIPVIALTALAMPGDRERCIEAGATDYVSKPVRLKQLVSLIRSHLKLRRSSALKGPFP